MRKIAIAAAIGGSLLLAGCGLPGEYREIAGNVRAAAEDENSAEAFLALTRADAEEALRSATVHGDLPAQSCWRAVISTLEKTDQEGFFTDGSKGVLSKYQRVRNIRRLVSGDGYEEIRIGCAAMIAESRSVLLRPFTFIGGL